MLAVSDHEASRGQPASQRENRGTLGHAEHNSHEEPQILRCISRPRRHENRSNRSPGLCAEQLNGPEMASHSENPPTD